MEEEKDLERELRKFNWGAAYFGLIWAILNGCFKKWFINSLIVSIIATIVGLAIIFIPNIFVPGFAIIAGIFSPFIVALLIFLTVFIFVGLKANRWAWEGDKYDNIEHFNKIQKIL